MYINAHGMQSNGTPLAMTESDIGKSFAELANAGKLAVEAGLDGVELHAANGYLIGHFFNAKVNLRKDG